MLRRLSLVPVLALVAGVLGVLGAPAASADTACNGTISNRTITGNLTVAPGASCILDNVHVTGNVLANSPRQLLIRGSQIDAGLFVNGFQTAATESSVCSTRIGGNVTISGIPAGAIGGSEQTFNLGDDFDDSFTSLGGFSCGPVQVGGNVTISNNGSKTEMGRSRVGGSVTVTNNTGEVELERNHIGSTLSCSGNTSVANDGETNTAVTKTGQCASL